MLSSTRIHFCFLVPEVGAAKDGSLQYELSFFVAPQHRTASLIRYQRKGSLADPGGPGRPQDFFKIMQFSGNFEHILGSDPTGVKTPLGPRDQNPASAPEVKHTVHTPQCSVKQLSSWEFSINPLSFRVRPTTSTWRPEEFPIYAGDLLFAHLLAFHTVRFTVILFIQVVLAPFTRDEVMLAKIMEPAVANWSVQTARKSHQRVCKQICFRVLCELDLRKLIPTSLKSVWLWSACLAFTSA